MAEMVQLPKDKYDQLVAIAQQAQAQQQGGQGESKKKPSTLEGILSIPKRIAGKAGKTIDYVDGFSGSFIRSSAVSYNLACSIPLMLVNPLLGGAFAAIATPFTYYASNAVYKVARGTIKAIFYPFLHPINVMKAGYNTALHPWETFKFLKEQPKVFIKSLLTIGKSNKLGRTLGSMFGAGRGLFHAMPDVTGSLVQYAGHKLGPLVERVSDGASAALSQASSAYWNMHVREPFAPALAAAGNVINKVQIASPFSSAYDTFSSYLKGLTR